MYYFFYRRIKPEEIKSLGLIRRENVINQKKKDKRELYHELLLQMKNKKEMMEKKQLEKETSYRARQVGMRVGVHSSAVHRQTYNTIEKEETL